MNNHRLLPGTCFLIAAALLFLPACKRDAPPPKKNPAPATAPESGAAEPGDANATAEPAQEDEAAAIMLFNGKDLEGWEAPYHNRGNRWKVGKPVMHAERKQVMNAEEGGDALINTDILCADLHTTQNFTDFNLKFDFMLPETGNSGVYLLGQYEMQVSHEPDADRDMAVGSIPRLLPPLEVVEIVPGEWHSYEIEFRAARFDEAGEKTQNAKLIRVAIDGTLVQENVEIPEITIGGIIEEEAPEGPIMLQGTHTSVAFRNMRLIPRGEGKEGTEGPRE